MNNKGQTLVVFVIILPILLMIFTFVIDLGFLYVEKKHIESSVLDSVKYYLNNVNNDDVDIKTNELLNKNIKNVGQIIINDTKEYVEIKVSKNRKSIYSIITNDTEIKVSYKGYKDSKKIIKG